MTKRKKLLLLPLLVIPFLCFMFYSLGGGRGAPETKKAAGTGFNSELPGARFDKQKQARNKLEFYQQADQDSMRRREFLRRDPYSQKTDSGGHQAAAIEDNKADELLQRLDRLKEAIRQPAPPPVVQHAPLLPPLPIHSRPPAERRIDSVEEDPQLEKLSTMLDKIIRIQHPTEKDPAIRDGSESFFNPDSATAVSLPAVTQQEQVLVTGATISLRLTAEAKINGVIFPQDQLLYGVVSISNDRMLVTINAIRRQENIYPVVLQVYDLDGLPGIHIPGSLGRETVKQSADQSINSMGVMGLDPSPLAQVTNAGVMTARSLLGRKVRQVRVAVKAGYQVLLRNAKMGGRIQVMHAQGADDSLSIVPEPASFVPFLHRAIRRDKMTLILQGIYLRDHLLWIVLRLENHSPIGYSPGYVRWYIRDKQRGRRVASQEVAISPLYVSPAKVLEGDSCRVLIAGFRPFALPGDKELVLQLAEGNGARELVLTIEGKELLKVKRYE